MSFLKRYTIQEVKSGMKQYLETASEMYLPGVSIDTVIFSFFKNNLNVLLLRLDDSPYYVIPGGYIEKNENLDDAAFRILKERTGINNIYLEQFYTAGNTHRNDNNFFAETFKKMGIELPQGNWFEQRFISVCYLALIDQTKVNLEPGMFFTECKWENVQSIPKLLYDHNLVIEKAIQRLQADLDQKLIAYNLLNETFTMAELQKLYEAVYQKEFTRTNFQRRMLGLDILERLEKQYTGKAHKAPFLYRFKLK